MTQEMKMLIKKLTLKQDPKQIQDQSMHDLTSID